MWCLSVSQSLNALDGSQPNLIQGAAGRSGNTGYTDPSTHKGRPRNSPLSEPVSGTEGLLSVIDDRGSAHFWSWHVLALLYLVNIILIISLTSPAVECVGVCVCVRTHREGIFHALSCPGMCNEILSSVFKTLGVPAIFTFEVFSPSSPLLLPLPSHPRVLPWNGPPKVTYCLICSTFEN